MSQPNASLATLNPIAAPTTPAGDSQPIAPGTTEELREEVVKVIKTCFDPEIPVNIYELGLIYTIDVSAERSVAVKMTLTSPMCPVAGSLPPDVERKIAAVPTVTSAKVEVVWDPPWDPSKMSDAAKLQLNMF